ncbi:MAG: hypothetical protein C4297_10230 [Gemmataceae bacterium]
MDRLVTLTTDFGTRSPYVAAMKGVILSINPQARIVDLSHDIPPQDITHAAFFLREALKYFPPGSLHVVVVDPGVGTGRALLYVELGEQRILAPDNGVWTLCEATAIRRVVRLEHRAWWRAEVSRTFHGRDVLAPVAGFLSLGLAPDLLGPRVSSWQTIQPPSFVDEGLRLCGEVWFVDDFGNLITSIPGAALPAEGPVKVTVGGQAVTRHVATYGEAAPGEAISLISSSGYLEIAVVQGSAAVYFNAGRGAPVRVWRQTLLAQH